MPLWNVYCTEGTYSSEQKRAFAEAITDIYASEDGGLPEMAMPRFYVVVAFHDLPTDSLFVGGVRATTSCASPSTTSLMRCQPNYGKRY